LPAQNLTPPTKSYTCKTIAGELSWDNVNKVLKVQGQIFIDGSAYVDAGNAVATYSGRATLYIAGTFVVKNAKLCALKNGAGDDCNWDGWNPNDTTTSALAVAVFGNAENSPFEATEVVGSSAAFPIGIQIKSGAFQGLLYARHNVQIVTTSRAQGPIVTPKTVDFGNTTAGTFPPFAIVPTGTPGTPPPPATLEPAAKDYGG
jgi:hypothetical protein